MGDVEPELRTELGKLNAQLSTAREELVDVEASIARESRTIETAKAELRELTAQRVSEMTQHFKQMEIMHGYADIHILEIRKDQLEQEITRIDYAISMATSLLQYTQMSASEIEQEISYMQQEIDRKKNESDHAYYDLSQPQMRHNPTDSSFEKKKLAILTRLLEEKRRLPEVPGLNEFFDGAWDRLCDQYKRAIGYIERDLSSIAPSERAKKLKLLDDRRLRREQLANAIQRENTACMSLIDRLNAMGAAPNVATAISRLGVMKTAIQRDMNLVAVDLDIAALERQIEDNRALMASACNDGQTIGAMPTLIAAQETRLQQKLAEKKQIEKT